MSKETRNASVWEFMTTSLPKMAIAIGNCVVFIYCAFIIHYFPSGLTVGDSLFFFFAALAFGCAYTALIYVGLIPAYTIFNFCKDHKIWARAAKERMNRASSTLNLLKARNKHIHSRYIRAASPWLMRTRVLLAWAGNLFIVIVCLVPFLILCWYLYDKDDGVFSIHPAINALLAGILITIGIEIIAMRPTRRAASKEQRRIIGTVVIIVGVIFPALVSPIVMEKLEHFTFRTLGINVENAAVIASADEFRVIQAVADKMKIPVFSCSVDGQGERMVSNVDILWHGVGDRSLLAFRMPDRKGAQNPRLVKFEVHREGIRVIQLPDGTSLTSCLSVDTKVLFNTASATITPEGQRSLKKAIDDMEIKARPYGLRIKNIWVTGHADRVVFQSKDKSNQKLSEDRAEAVKEALTRLQLAQPINDAMIESTGVGVAGGTENCRISVGTQEVEECLSSDRRVDIKIFLARPSDSSKAVKAN